MHAVIEKHQCTSLVTQPDFPCRIYVDMVVNHVCGIDGTSGTGSGGSFYDTSTLTFPQYSEDDFNCCQAYDEGNCLNGAQCDTGSCGIV